MPFVRGPENEDYEVFYRNWRDTHKELLNELRESVHKVSEPDLASLVEQVRRHYEHYYTVKATADRQDVIQMLNPKWRSPLETAMLWLGGWRPSMSVHLVHALTGQKIKGCELLGDVVSPSMKPLSQSQLKELERVQRKVAEEENLITYKMAELQQSLGDEKALAASQAGNNERLMMELAEEKITELRDLVIKSDRLRLRSLCETLDVFDAVQAAQYLLGAGQLYLVISKVGELRLNGHNGETK